MQHRADEAGHRAGVVASSRVTPETVEDLERHCVSLCHVRLERNVCAHRHADNKSPLGQKISRNPAGTQVPSSRSRLPMPFLFEVMSDEHANTLAIVDVD